MFPHKIFKRVLKEKFPHEHKSVKFLGGLRYTDNLNGFDGSKHDPYYIRSFRVGDTIVTLENLSSISWVSVDAYKDDGTPIFCLSYSYNAK